MSHDKFSSNEVNFSFCRHCTRKWSFLLRISPVGVVGSAGNCGFGRIFWGNLNGGLQFLGFNFCAVCVPVWRAAFLCSGCKFLCFKWPFCAWCPLGGRVCLGNLQLDASWTIVLQLCFTRYQASFYLWWQYCSIYLSFVTLKYDVNAK